MITLKQQTILDYIRRYQDQAGFPPTITEIAEAVGLGRSTVHYHLEWLEIKGRIERKVNSPRAIRLTQ